MNICMYGASSNSISQVYIDKASEFISGLKQENEKLRFSLNTWQYSDTQHLLKINVYENLLNKIKEFCLKHKEETICELIKSKIDEVLE